MKKTIMTCLALLCLTTAANAQSIQSPDGKVTVTLELAEGGKPCYKVNYQGLEVLNNSALGVVTNIGDFTQGLEVKEVAQNKVNRTYDLRNIKQSSPEPNKWLAIDATSINMFFRVPKSSGCSLFTSSTVLPVLR